MSEAEILSVRNEVTGLVLTVFSVSFSMITAYLVALWLFLRHAPGALRLLAFLLLTAGLGFLGAMSIGLNDILAGTERAWGTLARTVTGIPGFGSERPEWLGGFSMYEAAAALGALAFLAIYAALAYLTFLYRWPSSPE
jgi:hypothetical protein